MTDVPSGSVEVSADTSGPDEVVWLRAGAIELGAVPALGGRVLALRLAGREVLYRNDALLDERLHRRPDHGPEPDGTMATWRNYGGDKTWPAPQGWDGPGQWAGPPDPVLDSGPYGWTVAEYGGRARLTMTSDADPRSGLTVVREVDVETGTSTVTVTHRLVNTGGRPVRWAPWNVLQLPGPVAGDGWFAGVDDSAVPVRGLLAGTGLPKWTVDAGVARVEGQDVVGKLALPGASGWLATVSGGYTVTQHFAVDPAGLYPDDGARAEVWLECPQERGIESLGGLRPTARILESEVVGRLADLAPGEHTELTVRLSVCRSAGTPRRVRPAGVVLRDLTAENTATGVRLTGGYATFADGDVLCRVLGVDGRPLAERPVAAARAGGELSLDVRLTAQPGAHAVELRVARPMGPASALDNAMISPTLRDSGSTSS
ncbi:DUF4380 domain-containing protein [Actinoallomurus iriomotensis]|uniref:DUF4380 domain-containing protein n=1 Tax=Actinoallomurus iriomotensis TaxID=478107 RepID=A0A9W6RUN0_9ACTN|nr:DUF4380 domain-containing protein [Actinoallomurus iriomotensis]GLY82171.1 hypothetical protein Airi02_001030 [Actinoallomurus iriomotensis]